MVLFTAIALYGCKSTNGIYFKNPLVVFDTIEGITMPRLPQNKIKIKKRTIGNIRQAKTEAFTYTMPNVYKSYKFVNDRVAIDEYYIRKLDTINCTGLSKSSCYDDAPLYLYYHIVLRYFLTGKLQYYKLYLSSKNGFNEIPVGTWLQFNKEGEEIKKIEHEEIYSTSILDILNLKMAKCESHIYSKIYRIQHGDKKYWVCNYYDIVVDKVVTKILDDMTGKIIGDASKELQQELDREYLELKYSEIYNGWFDYN